MGPSADKREKKNAQRKWHWFQIWSGEHASDGLSMAKLSLCHGHKEEVKKTCCLSLSGI